MTDKPVRSEQPTCKSCGHTKHSHVAELQCEICGCREFIPTAPTPEGEPELSEMNLNDLIEWLAYHANKKDREWGYLRDEINRRLAALKAQVESLTKQRDEFIETAGTATNNFIAASKAYEAAESRLASLSAVLKRIGRHSGCHCELCTLAESLAVLDRVRKEQSEKQEER